METDEHGVLTREEMNKVTKEWVEKSSKFWMARDKEHELVARAQHDYDVEIVRGVTPKGEILLNKYYIMGTRHMKRWILYALKGKESA